MAEQFPFAEYLKAKEKIAETNKANNSDWSTIAAKSIDALAPEVANTITGESQKKKDVEKSYQDTSNEIMKTHDLTKSDGSAASPEDWTAISKAMKTRDFSGLTDEQKQMKLGPKKPVGSWFDPTNPDAVANASTNDRPIPMKNPVQQRTPRQAGATDPSKIMKSVTDATIKQFAVTHDAKMHSIDVLKANNGDQDAAGRLKQYESDYNALLQNNMSMAGIKSQTNKSPDIPAQPAVNQAPVQPSPQPAMPQPSTPAQVIQQRKSQASAPTQKDPKIVALINKSLAANGTKDQIKQALINRKINPAIYGY